MKGYTSYADMVSWLGLSGCFTTAIHRHTSGNITNRNLITLKHNKIFTCAFAGLQIYAGPGSLSHAFKIWPITFQGSGPSGPILFSCEKLSNFNKKYSSYSESLSKAVGPVDPSFLVVKNSPILIKNIHLTVSL